MTTREMFEVKARANGVTVTVSEPTKLVYVSTNGKMESTFLFTEDGNLQKSLVKKLDF